MMTMTMTTATLNYLKIPGSRYTLRGNIMLNKILSMRGDDHAYATIVSIVSLWPLGRPMRPPLRPTPVPSVTGHFNESTHKLNFYSGGGRLY